MKKKAGFSKWYLAVILLLTYLPIFVVIVYSFNSSRINTIWEHFSLDWYRQLFADRGLMEALRNSLYLAAVSSSGAAVIATMGALGLSKLHFPGKSVLEFLSTFPMMTPEIILGMVFLAFFGLIGIPLGMGALVIAHMSFCIPYVYMLVKARLAGMDPSYVEAARDLGASGMRAFWDVTFPAILPSVLSGMLLAFAMSMDDVVISIFVNGATSNTLPVKIFTQLKTGVSPKINALCTLMFLTSVLFVGLASLINRKKQETTDFSGKGVTIE